MTAMRDDGEPISHGQLDRAAVERRALKDVLFAVGLFAVVVLVNGLLAILFIELMQVIGWWGAPTSEASQDAMGGPCARMRIRGELTPDC